MAALLFAVYFLPSIIAGLRDHPSFGGIMVLNLLLGWTVLGWIIALVWSCSATPADIREASAGGRKMRTCPECAEEILADARKCKHCGSEVSPAWQS